MKLKNKKTGEIVDFRPFCFYQTDSCKCPSKIYESLSDLNEEWEDYKPTDPLIKGEKIRKAVRAWAEANEIETAVYDDYWVSFGRDDKVIGFKDVDNCLGLYGLVDNTTYTITELCGEEEE